MATASIEVKKQVEATRQENGWTLLFQWCEYRYFEEGKRVNSEMGYRFIWKRPDGRLQAARGQARLPSIAVAEEMFTKAKSEGWGHYTDSDEASRSAT